MPLSLRRTHLKGVKFSTSPGRTTHPGLWLDKWAEAIDDENKAKKEALAHLVNLSDWSIYRKALEKWVHSFQATAEETSPCIVMASSRIAVGLGADSVLETNIRLHRTYGAPILPGSALKGLAAHFCRSTYGAASWEYLPFANWSKEAQEQRKDHPYSYHDCLFGRQEEAGGLIFHDGWWIPGSPDTKSPFLKDVMTVHHAEYYSNKEDSPPADWDSPNPIPYVNVRPGACFLLIIEGAAGWREMGRDILLKALGDWGIGAKTSSGYGRMVHVAAGEGTNDPALSDELGVLCSNALGKSSG